MWIRTVDGNLVQVSQICAFTFDQMSDPYALRACTADSASVALVSDIHYGEFMDLMNALEVELQKDSFVVSMDDLVEKCCK